jgi:hypothetical protein
MGLVKDRGPNTEEDQQAWVDFIAATGRSVAQYSKTYATAVIQAAQSNPESDKAGRTTERSLRPPDSDVSLEWQIFAVVTAGRAFGRP